MRYFSIIKLAKIPKSDKYSVGEAMRKQALPQFGG